MVRVLNREELKIEIAKFKNISLKIIKDYQKNGIKIPGYAGKLADEMDQQTKTGTKVPIGSKAEKVEKERGEEEKKAGPALRLLGARGGTFEVFHRSKIFYCY